MTIKLQARALLATTALALAGLAATAGGAHAATRAPATPATPALHGTGIALGSTSTLYGNAFTEAPNGAVFFSRGAVVYVVGDTVWAWTDWATDGSGFEYAQVDRMHTTSSAVHVVNKDAFPGDMSADAAGLYFETVHGVTDDLAHANPTTSAVQYRKAPVDAPLALVSARRVPEKDESIAGTGLGLLVLAQPCRTPGAYQLLNGPAVIEASDTRGSHADLSLVRLSS